MGNRVEYDMERIMAFRAALERFSEEVGALRSRLEGAVATAATDWQDSQFEKAAERAMEAGQRVETALGALYPDVVEFLDRQKSWHEEYTS